MVPTGVLKTLRKKKSIHTFVHCAHYVNYTENHIKVFRKSAAITAVRHDYHNNETTLNNYTYSTLQ